MFFAFNVFRVFGCSSVVELPVSVSLSDDEALS